MKTFNDSSGNTWSIAVNVGTIKRLRSALDVNLLDAVEGKLIERLVSDPVLLCDVIFVLCQPEAMARGISDEEFGLAMAGDAIDSATTALLEELVAFFPSGKRQVLTKALAKLKAFEAKAIEVANKRLDDPKLDEQLSRVLDPSLELTPGG
ncbi:MAG: hypothetical protein R3C03_23605 [Pirellulaceae bacterium]